MKDLNYYLEYEQPSSYIVDNDNYNDKYETPVLTAGQSFILGYTNEINNIFPKEKLPVIIFDDFTTSVQFVDFPFKVKSSAMKILHPTSKANIKFFYYFLKNIKKDTTTHKRYWISEYSKMEVADISIEEQNEIVSKLDFINEMIENRKESIKDLEQLIISEFNALFGNPVINNKNWPTKKVIEVCPSKNYKGEYEDKVWLLNLDMVESNTGGIIEYIYENKSNVSNSTCTFNEENVLYSKLRPYLNKVVIPDRKGYATSEMIPLHPDSKVLDRYFLAYLLRNKTFVDYISEKVSGAKMPRVIMDEFRNFEIILPPIKMQKQFANIIFEVNKLKDNYKKDIEDLEKLLEIMLYKYFCMEVTNE